jgi:hypothetical protein
VLTINAALFGYLKSAIVNATFGSSKIAMLKGVLPRRL